MPAKAEVAFGPYVLHLRSRSLTRGSEPVGLSQCEYDVLHLLVRRPNVVLSKDALIRAGWQDVAVGDNSVEKLVSKLRRQLDADDLNRYIKTVPRQGYQFVAPVTAMESPAAATDLELLLAPHRAFTEGRAALDSLQCDRIAAARATFEGLVRQHPGDAKHHIGMANACAMQFEATRTDPAQDAEALRLAERHAKLACGLDPDLAEAWATLGFVLERTGPREYALAALDRAATLEPDNWRHQVRLALGSWGETRLRAARAALKRCPQLPLAHWLAATVFVARHALDQAERDVDLGLAVAGVESPEAAPYSTVALHWLKGLLRNAAGTPLRPWRRSTRSSPKNRAATCMGVRLPPMLGTPRARAASPAEIATPPAQRSTRRSRACRGIRWRTRGGVSSTVHRCPRSASPARHPPSMPRWPAPHDWCTPVTWRTRCRSCRLPSPLRLQVTAAGCLRSSRCSAFGAASTPGLQPLPYCTSEHADGSGSEALFERPRTGRMRAAQKGLAVV